MISHNDKFIFIHIPKTAGSSICTSLCGRLRSRIGDNQGRPIKRDHTTPSHGVYPLLWKKYYTFTFVRNPWDRAVSLFFHSKKYPHRKNYLIANNVGFNEFLTKHVGATNESGALEKKPQFLGLWASQNTWLTKRVRGSPLRSNVNYNFIGRFESLQEDFDAVCTYMSISCEKLPHVKRTSSGHKPYWEYYNERTRNIIARLYRTDINKFNYKFGE